MNKQTKWFNKVRGSYLPCSWQGWLTYVPYLAYLIGSFFIDNVGNHNVGYVLYTMVPQWVAATVILSWIAEHKS